MCKPFVTLSPIYLDGNFNMISITPDIVIHEKELTFEFMRSSGPGGQNVNKVSTAVLLRFDVRASGQIPFEVKQRLKTLAGKRMTEDGMLIIKASRFRKQEQNRQDAVERLVRLLRARVLSRCLTSSGIWPDALTSKRKRTNTA